MKKNGKNNGNPFKNMPNVHVVKIDNKEKQAEKQALYVDFWESMTENEYIETVKMINTNQFDINSKLFKDKDLLEFVKMKIKQGNEQADQESKTFFELLPKMSAQVELSMIEFINDHFTEEQTHLDYVSLVTMARERAVIEHELFEKVAEQKAKFLIFWESLDNEEKEICKTEMYAGCVAEIIEEYVNDNFTSEIDFLKLLENQINIEKATAKAEQAELDEQELERQERLGDLIEENLRNEELEEEETDRLEKEFFKGYAQETEIEEVTEIKNEILTQNPTTETMKTQKEVASEVKKEVSKSEKTTKKEKVVKEKASNTTVNNTQSITNNTVNFNLETPKPKMSIADKIVEAQKLIVLSEKKQILEDRLKAFHGYLHANKDGDNFTLMSLDKEYSFSTNNAELVKEVNTVLERFLKNKIQEFETELANFQI